MPALGADVAELLGAYEAETARAPAQVEAALAEVTAVVGGAAPATAAAAMSASVKAVLVGVVVTAGAWLAWEVSTPSVQDSVAASDPHRPGLGVPSPGVAEDPGPDEEPDGPPEGVARIDAAPADRDGHPEAGPGSASPSSSADDADASGAGAAADPAAPPGSGAGSSTASGPKRSHRGRGGTEGTRRPSRGARTGASPNSKAPGVDGPASLGADLRLLKRARTALRGGDGTRALARVREHRETFPHSVLSEERDATEVMALCALGRVGDAEKKAAQYRRRFPGSDRDVLAECRDDSDARSDEAREPR